MQHTFILKGLDCANCGAKIEKAVRSLDGVSEASLNFVTLSLTVKVADCYDGDLFQEVCDIVNHYEPEVEVSVETNIKSEPTKEKLSLKLILHIFGAVIYLTVTFFHLFFGFEHELLPYVYILSFLFVGYDIVFKAIRNIFRGRVFDENFLMSVATFGAFAIGEYPEAVAVMLFYQVGEYFQERMVRSSRRSISELMDIRPGYANIMKDGVLTRVLPETVALNDRIIIRAGDLIPLDGVVVEGTSTIDTSALTGESQPRVVNVGDTVLSGCTNLGSLLTVEVTALSSDSTVSKIIALVETASNRKATVENFITKFARYYTPIVVVLAALVSIVPTLLFGAAFSLWLKRGLLFLVVSCPCALVISIPLSFFSGIGAASRRGVLVKGGNYLDALNHLDGIVFDKTGTLTKGIFEVVDILPGDNFTKEELLKLAAHAETFSGHPIALSILDAYHGPLNREKLRDYTEIPGHGISVTLEGQQILAGSYQLMKQNDIDCDEITFTSSSVYIAVDSHFAGTILISDKVKDDSKRTITQLKAKGITNIAMLTGDNGRTAEVVAKEVGIDRVYSELLPHQKVNIIEQLIAKKRDNRNIAFVGDGINDAPVLARADIGIAMGALGSDAAIEAADVVLMTDETSRLIDAVEIAAFTRRIVMQNIYISLTIKGIFLLLGAFGLATMWEAVFADVGVALLAVLNASRIGRRHTKKMM